MKKIVILGNSLAAVKALEEFKKTGTQSEVTMFCTDGNLPSQPHLFSSFLAREIKENDVLYRPASFYKDQNITVLLDKKIARVDFKKGRIITEEKNEYFYDSLIISHAPNIRFPDIKGVNKTGVFDARRLSSMKDITAILPIIESVSVQADTIEGLKIAVALAKRGKEVFFMTESAHILDGILDAETARVLHPQIEQTGVRIFTQNGIAEILGDADAKAVRLKAGKVLASQIVIMGQVRPDWRIFADSPLQIKEGINVDKSFRSSVENVFALGEVCTIAGEELSCDERVSLNILEEQGRTVGLNLAGQSAQWARPAKTTAFNIFGINFEIAQGKEQSMATDA